MRPVAVSPKRSPHSGRREPVNLLEHAVAPGTLKPYRAATISFAHYLIASDEDPDDADEFDDVLLDYIQGLYDDGRGKSTASNTLHGIGLYLPQLRPLLPKARMAIRGWNRLQTGRSYPPLTWELASALAVHLRRKPGLERYGIGVVLAFDCLLRVSELVNLRREDVALSTDQRFGMRRLGEPDPGVIIVIRQAKTGKNQWVSLKDPQLITLLTQLVANTKPGHFLFPFSAASFRRTFKQGCSELKLSSLYVPHSLRHGGATRYKHRLGWTMEDVMLRGRWASGKSARTYIQAGVAMAMATQVPKSLTDLGFRFSNALVKYLSITRSKPRAWKT